MEFCDLIGDIDDGRVMEALNEQLGELVEAAQRTGQAAKLTLTLSIVGEGNRAAVAAKVVMHKPGLPLKPSAFFWGSSPGELSRDNPKQMVLRRLDEPRKAKAREDADVDPETGEVLQ